MDALNGLKARKQASKHDGRRQNEQGRTATSRYIIAIFLYYIYVIMFYKIQLQTTTIYNTFILCYFTINNNTI